MYAHPPRCSSTALLYTKQLKSRSYIFWFCWQLLPSHQRLIKAFWMLHLVCYLPDGIIIPVRKAGRSLIPYGHASRESTSRIMVPLQVLPPVTVSMDMHTLRDCVPHIFIERVTQKLTGQLFFLPSPCCKGGLSTLQSTHPVVYMLHTQPLLGWLQLTA